MKNISLNKKDTLLRTLLLLFICTAPFLSCKKFLEEPIDDRSPLTTIEDLEKTLITLQPYSDYHFTDMMTDDYSYKDIAGHVSREYNEKIRPIFTFEITRQNIDKIEMLASGFNPNTAFLRYYFIINNASLLIDRANKIKNEGGDAARADNVIGQSLAIKAYCNFMLTNLFGKQYNSSTAGSDLAVPYIGEYNSNAIVNRPRATVDFMYKQVEADWLQALTLIDDKNAVTSSKFYFSKRAIYGLLSKFYLNKMDWANSIKYADLVLAVDKVPLNMKTLRAKLVNDPGEYSKGYMDPTNSSYLLMGNNTYQLIADLQTGYYPYPLMQFYSSNGGGNFGDFANDEMIQSSILFSDKMPQKFYYSYSSARRSFNMPLITVDETIFNKAEATIQNDNAISTATTADLYLMIDNMNFTSVASNRLKAQVDAVSNKNDAITLLLNLKRYRFFCEGIRWFDIKRHNLPVTHNYNGTNYIIDGKNAEAYVIKLPLEEIQFNPDAK
jgi:hypothetical protein